MQALLKEILSSIPKYISNFLQVLTKPASFITGRDLDQENALTEALTFVGISFALGMILIAPFRPPQKDFWTYFGGWLLLGLMSMLISAGVVRLAWKIVGGAAPFEKLLKVHSYHFGVANLLALLVMLCAYGVGRVFNPALYKHILSATIDKPAQLTPDQLFSKALIAGVIIFFVGLTLIFVWLIVAWGAYRILNQASKGKSFVAFCLYTVLSFPPMILWVFVGINVLN